MRATENFGSYRRGFQVIKRNLGKSVLQVSLVGLGCNNFGLEHRSRSVAQSGACGARRRTYSSSIQPIFTAEMAARKQFGGRRWASAAKTSRRDEIRLPDGRFGKSEGRFTPVFLTAVEASLRRLGTDWIELYRLHFPDPLTPMEETLRALDDLVRQGKVRYIGSSNLTAWQVVEAHWIARELGHNAFASSQNEYSLVVRDPERELFQAMEACGLGLLPYLPASGLLSGK